MDFEQFIDICGRSLFAEEYRGDFDAAWEYLQQHKPDDATDPVERAEYLRCETVYSILIGRYDHAYAYLEEIYSLLGVLPPEWGLRYTNYTLLADYTRRYPPCLRFNHERGKPVNITLISDIVGPGEMSKRFMERVNEYLPLGNPRDQGLAQILGVVMWFPMRSRHVTATCHPLFPFGRDQAPGADCGVAVEEAAKNFVRYREMAEGFGAGALAMYLQRLIVELHFAGQSVDSASELRGLYEAYERKDDKVGMGSCKMMEGDNMLGPVFAGPVSLNLVIVEPASAIGDDSLWDPVEVDLQFHYDSKARECYDAALDLFRQSKCKRGQAAVLLRQGCSLHNFARYLQPGDGKKPGLLEEAEKKLTQSQELFGKDEANVQVVKVHQILLDITRGLTAHVRQRAKEIGQWAVNAKNECVAHTLGLLLFRFARQEWNQFSRIDNAIVAWECAYHIFKSIGSTISVLQTVVSRAWMQHEMCNPAATRVLVNQALEMVGSAIEYYDSKLASPAVVNADRGTLLTSKFNTLWTLGGKVSSIFARMDDWEALSGWNERLGVLVEHDESFRYFRERLATDDPICESRGFPYTPAKLKGLWQKAMADDAATFAFASAGNVYRRYLDLGDVLKAEDALRRFVDEQGALEHVYTGYLCRILACERIGDLEKAREVLDSMDDNTLFDTNLDGFLQGLGVKLIFQSVAENALTFTIFSGDWGRAYRTIHLIERISPSFFECINSTAYDFSFRLGNYGAIMLRNGQPEVAFRRLLECRQMIELRRNQTTDVDARMGNSAFWTGEVYLNLARVCLQYDETGVSLSVIGQYSHGHPDSISWTEHALLFVEGSRARAVLDALRIQSPSGRVIDSTSTSLSEVLYKRRTLRTLLALRHPTSEQEIEIQQLQSEINELEASGLSTTSQFIDTTSAPIDPRLLYESIDENAVVIEATFGPTGCIAFAVTRDGIQSFYQGDTRMVDIRRPVMRFMKIMREMTGYLGEKEEDRKQQLNELSGEISSVLLTPFIEIIRRKTHIIFSVSDPLTAFPFSALLVDDKPLIMHATVSQIPSLTVLYHISQRKSASSPTVSVFAKSPIGEPSDSARNSNESNLHMAGIEAVNIARLFSTWPIEASTLTRKAFREYVQGDSSIMHIGTHGDMDYQHPLLSSISIGEELRVLDLSTVQCNANLLVFAACLSGLGKATAGSEVLGFSHVVLGTGCQAFIGTLWKVSDFASMLMMTLFYRLLRTRMKISLADGLREAQMELLQLDREKAGLLLDQILDDWSSTDADRSPEDFVPDAAFLLWTSKMILDQLDWKSPFYWAPFVLMGYGGFSFASPDGISL